jgi:hypothetical protein
LIHDVIRDHHLDLIAVTETWMFSDEPDAVAHDIAPDGFRVLHACRGKSTDTHRGGGIAIIHRESIDLVTADIGRFCEFEHLSVKLRSSTAPSQITCIYRQPAAVSNAFCEDLSDLFEQLLLSGQRQVVCGDFNCPGKDGTQLDDRLQEVLSCYNQLQLVTQSTHQAGNLLDLVIVPDQAEEFVCDVSVHSLLFSDHSLVRCRLGVPPSRPSTVSYTYRNIKRIDLQSFRHGVLDSQLYDPDVLESFSADAYTELFEAEISRVLDTCAPLRMRTQRRGNHDRGFLSIEARTAKRTCRRLERHFRRTKTLSDKQKFVQSRSIARELINKSRADVLTAKVNESTGNPKKMWNTTRQLLHSKPVSNMSDDECASMSSVFCQFFSDKVTRIQHVIADIIITISDSSLQTSRPFAGSPLTAFTSVSPAEVHKLINSSLISRHLVMSFQRRC